jgi:hypothetical protein
VALQGRPELNVGNISNVPDLDVILIRGSHQ